MQERKIKSLSAVTWLICLLVFSSFSISAATNNGTLTITGVPEEVVSGNYDPNEGIFKANVSEFPEAVIQVEFEDLDLYGQQMEWYTKNNHLILQINARLEKPAEFTLQSDLIEYFGDEERLIAIGNVVVVTEDSTVYANHLAYDEKTDEALFTGQVRIEFADGTLEGEKFLMLLEQGELQFYGAFQGEFQTDSNN